VDSGQALVLASSSPRRQQILAAIGLSFVVEPADIDEAPHWGETPEALASRLAVAKARLAAGNRPGQTAIGSDTVVALDDQPLGKPESADDAAHMLRLLRAREHRVITSVAAARGANVWEQTDATRVWMRDYSDQEIDGYIATGDPMDKAGAYAIQHPGFHPVARIDGCYLTVVGLSLPALYAVLAGAGIHSPRIARPRLEAVCPNCVDARILPTA